MLEQLTYLDYDINPATDSPCGIPPDTIKRVVNEDIDELISVLEDLRNKINQTL